MKKKLNLALSGHFKFIATKPDGSQRVLADWFDNLILDSGLNRLGTAGVMDRCQVGSGNTAPANGQTGLVALEATTTTIQSTLAGTDTPTNTYAWVRRTFRFSAGAAEGNLSEVGVGWSDGLFSRALIKDEGGDLTTITVLADEALDVVYELRAYPEMSDQVVNITISGTEYEFTIRPVRFSGNHGSGNREWPVQLMSLIDNGAVNAGAGGGASGWYAYDDTASRAAVTAASCGGVNTVSSGSADNSSSFRSSYSDNSYEREMRNVFGLAAGGDDFGGFVVLTPVGNYQIVVDPVIPKDATKILTLDYTIAWARRA